MQVNRNGDKPFIHNPEDKSSEGNSINKTVSDLRTRIRDDYQPKSTNIKGLVYPKGAEHLFKPVFNICDQDAIIEKLPLDILTFALRMIHSKDRVSTSLVSKRWGYASLDAARCQESSLLKSFGKFLFNCISEQYPVESYKLLKVTDNPHLPLSKDFLDIKNSLLKSRSDVIEILCPLKDIDFDSLGYSAALVPKPMLFDELFDLVKLHGEFNHESLNLSIDELSHILMQLSQLESLDKAYEVVERLKELTSGNNFARAAINLVNAAFKCERWDMALKSALLFREHEIIAFVLNFFSLGKFNEGHELLQTIEESIYLEEILMTIPLMNLMNEGHFDEAKELIELVAYDSLKKTILSLMDERLEAFSYQLIKKGRLDEVKLQAFQINNQYIRGNVIKKLVMNLIDLEKDDEALLLAQTLESAEHILPVAAMFISEGKLEEAEKLKRMDGWGGSHSDITDIFEKLSTNSLMKYHEASSQLEWRLNVNDTGDLKFKIQRYIAMLQLDDGNREQAIKIALAIKDPVIKAQTIKMIRES
jgi:hypothetical protein